MGVQQRLAQWLEKAWVNNVIVGVIVANAIILGLETSETLMASIGGLLVFLDRLCLAIFTLEIALKFVAYGRRFFTNGWNIFDLLIVVIALMPTAGGLSVLRALRILRVLRVISVAPRLRRVVEGFVTALPGM
ncbi:MAG: ion transporter, partial [Rhodobacteraceae bacterium]|nr:ion transporter [Paracoccaceae bacterium]